MKIQPDIGRLQSPIKACLGVSFSRTVKSVLLLGKITFMSANIPSSMVSYFKSSGACTFEMYFTFTCTPKGFEQNNSTLGCRCSLYRNICQQSGSKESARLLGAVLKCTPLLMFANLNASNSGMLLMCIVSHCVWWQLFANVFFGRRRNATHSETNKRPNKGQRKRNYSTVYPGRIRTHP